jgi:hypothetical protein
MVLRGGIGLTGKEFRRILGIGLGKWGEVEWGRN